MSTVYDSDVASIYIGLPKRKEKKWINRRGNDVGDTRIQLVKRWTIFLEKNKKKEDSIIIIYMHGKHMY